MSAAELNRWATTVHESAHAVIGRRHGIRIARAWISRNGRTGRVEWASNAWPEAAIVTALAGAAAGADDDGASQDREQARAIALEIWGFWANVALDHLRAICAAEVATAWADIERLAVALYQHGTLTGDQIETVLSNTPSTEAAGFRARLGATPFDQGAPAFPNREAAWLKR